MRFLRECAVERVLVGHHHPSRDQQGYLRRMRPPLRSTSWFAPTPPTVAIEIASRRITVVALAANAPIVTAYASEPLPEGAVVPAPRGSNIAQADIVATTLKRALEHAGLTSTKRAALVVPDSVARVSLLHFDQAPARAQELDEIVRWQVKKATPYSPRGRAHQPRPGDGRRRGPVGGRGGRPP